MKSRWWFTALVQFWLLCGRNQPMQFSCFYFIFSFFRVLFFILSNFLDFLCRPISLEVCVGGFHRGISNSLMILWYYEQNTARWQRSNVLLLYIIMIIIWLHCHHHQYHHLHCHQYRLVTALFNKANHSRQVMPIGQYNMWARSHIFIHSVAVLSTANCTIYISIACQMNWPATMYEAEGIIIININRLCHTIVSSDLVTVFPGVVLDLWGMIIAWWWWI